MINKVILTEGGNVEIDGIAAQRLDLNKVSRSKVVAEIDTALKLINSAFNKMYGVPLWNPKLIANKEFLSGSAFHFFNLQIPDDQFTKIKSSVGDIDTMVDKDLAEKAKDFLTKATGKQFGPAKLIGFKPNPGQDTLISLWQFNNPPVAVQVDMELVDYDKGSPTDWSKFSHSSAWEDLSVGVKGVFHKFLLRSLTHKDAEDRYIQMKTKLKKVNASNLAFAVTGGVREKFAPVIDPKTKKPAVAADGIGIYREIPASESNYVNDIKGMFTLLIGRKPAKGEEKYLGSFVGLLALINKYFTQEDKIKITSAFTALLFSPAAQQLYKGDPATDKREKEIALNKLIEVLKVPVDKSELAKTLADYYSKYKAESITEADAPDYKRQGIKHIYNPGSTVEMKDADFLAFVEQIANNGGTLDNIPITLKVDGAGIRFGKDESGRPFFMTSRVTTPMYADMIGVFAKYSQDNNGNPEQVARAAKYDKALDLIVNSDFIKTLPNDTIVQAEMMYNAMAEKTPKGLKFVNIPYEPKLLGKQMTLVPITVSKYSTGEASPQADSIIQKLIASTTPEIKIVGTELQHGDIDVSNIVEPIAKNIDALRTAIGSKKKNDPAKEKAKAVLSQARKAISDAIINSPNIKGKDKLGKTIEGLVIAMPNGQLAKVTSSDMKDVMAAKKAPTTGGNRTKAAVVTAGSFVGHVGHQKVVDTVIAAAKKLGGDPYVYISSKTGPDDPIPPEVKIATWKKLYPEYANIFQLIVSPDGSAPSPVKKIEKELVLPANSPYKKIVVMVGSDRYEGFKNWLATLEKRMKDPVALAKYGGTQDQVSFDTIEIPRGAALGGIDASFSQLRDILKDPNLSLAQKLEAWKKGFGNKLDDDWVKKLMMISAKGMGIKLNEIKKSPWDKMVAAVPSLKGNDERSQAAIVGIKKANKDYQDILDREKVKESDDFMPTIHDELNPKLFDHEGKMFPNVRQTLLDIAEDFKEFLGVHVPNLKDITISGSNAAYNYTPDSDIDLHLVVDVPQVDHDRIYRELFDAKKFQYNEQHNYTVKGFDVELYVQNASEEHVSNGIYSILNNDWIHFPHKINIDIDEENTRSKYDTLKTLILKALKSKDYELGLRLRKTLKKYRQVGLHSTGEFGAENLAWKALRSNGYIEKLHNMLNDLKDQELSLEGQNQPLTELANKPYPYNIDVGDIEETTAIFKTANNQDYVVVIGTAGGTDEYDAEVSFFARKGLYGVSDITNTGDAFKVFATVAEILKAYLNRFKSIKSFTFNAEYSEPSRVKLYNTMARMMPKFIPNFRFVGDGADYSADGIKVYRFEKTKKSKIKPAQESKGQLNELANKPYTYTNVAGNAHQLAKFEFTTDIGIKYRVLIVPGYDEKGKQSDSLISVEFSAYRPTENNPTKTTLFATGTGDAFRVFATVANILKSYLNSNPQITGFHFSSDNDEPSRVKLYSAMAKMMPKFIPGWKLANTEKGYSFHHYTFVKTNEGKRPSSLADYIEESAKPFVWKKDEPKKELTEMQKACILGGQEYTGEIE